MRVLDLFSGIGGGSLGFEMAGATVVAHSEIDRYASRVLEHHWPNVPNLGDIEGYEDWPDVSPEIIIGGSPCQAFSIAGLRGGLSDERGKLTLTYIKVVERFRPEWVVWENVPGALSVDGGRAFASLLQGLAFCGYHAEWRVLDASHVRTTGFCRAVPQRRRRVFLVGHSGKGSPGKILFDAESRIRDSQESEGTKHQASEASGNRLVANCLTRRMHKGMNSTLDEGQTPIVVNARQDPVVGDVPGSLDTDGGTHAVLDQKLRVRRLTPLECERLQGFPDGWTDVPGPNGKPMSDTQRYKMLGNSMAVNVVK